MRLTAIIKKSSWAFLLMTSLALMMNYASHSVFRETFPPSDSHNGGTLVWGTINPPTIINPIFTSHSVSTALLDLIFDPLVRIDNRGEVAPGLADRWEVSSDGKTYTFHLRPEVYFHNGDNLTAEDVKFTFDAISDPKNNSPWRRNFEVVESWTVISPQIIQARLKQPFPLFLSKSALGIVPRHLLKDKNFNKAAFNYSPVGTGPFRFKSWDKITNEITLEANSGYFEGRPHLDRIVVRVFKNNTDLWAALMRGEIDFVKFLNYDDFTVLKNDSSFKVYAVPTVMYFAIVYNFNDPILADKEIRKAFSYAIDRKKLMDIAGVPGADVKSSKNFETWNNTDYQPEKAKMMLANSGWVDTDNDGILQKGGDNLEVRLLVNGGEEYYLRMAAEIRQQLSLVGIKVRVMTTPQGGALSQEFFEKARPQMWLRMFSSTDNSYEATRNWYSLSADHGKSLFYKNERLDRLFEKVRSSDNVAKKESYKQIYQMIADDQLACFLFSPRMFHAVTQRVHNTDSFFTPYMPDYLLKDWFLN